MKSAKQSVPSGAAGITVPLSRFEDAPKSSGVYYIFLNEVLLYIGRTVNIRKRIGTHRCHIKTQHKLAWKSIDCNPSDLRFRFIKLPNIDLIDILERQLIALHRPPYNRRIDGRIVYFA